MTRAAPPGIDVADVVTGTADTGDDRVASRFVSDTDLVAEVGDARVAPIDVVSGPDLVAEAGDARVATIDVVFGPGDARVLPIERPGARRRGTLVALAAVLLLPGLARAERPTEGGLWPYDPKDILATHDHPDGLRVHYSVDGPSVVPLADLDADGVPDYVTRVADTAAEVLALYRDVFGLRPPRSEAEHDLGSLGGSEALDIYLVEFAGAADGHFGHDACDPDACAGHLLLENDFAGYAYADLAEAVDTVVSHELFHAVQAAYVVDPPVWFSEGTAVWAERAYRPDSRDFLRLCDAYLADTGRSLFKPPAGPVPAFAYGTALWWDFLIERHGPEFVDALLQVGGTPDLPAAIAELLLGRGDDLRAAWLEFSAWNLATGPRAGARDSHAYAEQLAGVIAEQDGSSLDDDDRFFSLTARYYRLDHPGGPLWFGLAAPAPGLEFTLQAVAGGAPDGPVEPPQLAWDGADPEPRILADLPAGGFWLAAVNPVLSDMSIQAHLCAAATREALACVDPLPAPGSTGDDTTGEGTTGDDTDEPAPPERDACGGCRTGSPVLAWLLPLLRRRRRRVP
ncbi:hypothetical protein SAMN02745121_03576 [Nannocystis exedens]|uniref:Uncharacterized protein n=1 Tax=Nannocystis exedens TaxID=54 RepID=A0A1I1Z0X6_9BACT|nr:MXAN_6640 family putative metalloprotease [Nannocystis exedens]PCC75214.1 hypothetical protein NAEX_08323 [Nannocystis exedens]SFE25465.1 hypothetical protein SAMN02745121_03576 [Nannocystis exedens]